MRAVVQRVSSASVAIDGETVGRIGRGYLVLLGVGHGDTRAEADKLWGKLGGLRINDDEDGKTNLSLEQVKGEVLVVSQFTLYADCRRAVARPSRRPAPRKSPTISTSTLSRWYVRTSPMWRAAVLAPT